MQYYTDTLEFGLRTISLLDEDVLIFKALPSSDKNAKYVPSQEDAISHHISLFGFRYSHQEMYSIKRKDGYIEAVYRRR